MIDHLIPLLAIFNAHRAEWVCGHLGDWAVVSPDGLLGFYPDYQEAYLVAVDAFGLEPFLLHEVLAKDRVETITRLLGV